jgi:hypothetical protein
VRRVIKTHRTTVRLPRPTAARPTITRVFALSTVPVQVTAVEGRTAHSNSTFLRQHLDTIIFVTGARYHATTRPCEEFRPATAQPDTCACVIVLPCVCFHPFFPRGDGSCVHSTVHTLDSDDHSPTHLYSATLAHSHLSLTHTNSNAHPHTPAHAHCRFLTDQRARDVQLPWVVNRARLTMTRRTMLQERQRCKRAYHMQRACRTIPCMSSVRGKSKTRFTLSHSHDLAQLLDHS